MKRIAIAVGAIATLSPLLGKGVSLADTPARATLQVSMNDARGTALREVPGTVVGEELERENGKSVYSFEIKPTAASEGTKEVKVDAETGSITAIESADAETQDADHEQEHEEEDDG
jgi:hypothetical protein